MRVEDIDTPRVRAGVEARQLDDLRFFGLDWDEGPDVGGPYAPYRQSERVALYDRALGALAERGLTYYCDCSRAEIARVASAPHAGEEGPRYPGTCRELGMARARVETGSRGEAQSSVARGYVRGSFAGQRPRECTSRASAISC